MALARSNSPELGLSTRFSVGRGQMFLSVGYDGSCTGHTTDLFLSKKSYLVAPSNPYQNQLHR